MTKPNRLPAFAPSASPPSPYPMTEMALLDHLRRAACAARAAPRSNLFEACAMLSLDRHRARSTILDTLVRGLPQALGSRPLFHRPGATDLSFDESWLLRLVRSLAQGDGSSFEFLIRSRILRSSRRNIAFLIGGLARAGEQ